MLELVADFGGQATAIDQLGIDQAGHGLIERRFRHTRDCGEQLVAKSSAQGGCQLRHFLDRRQAVQARHQRVMKRIRDGHGRQGAGQLVAIVALDQDPHFQDRLGELFDE